jgi:hypothetical protein
MRSSFAGIVLGTVSAVAVAPERDDTQLRCPDEFANHRPLWGQIELSPPRQKRIVADGKSVTKTGTTLFKRLLRHLHVEVSAKSNYEQSSIREAIEVIRI